ncbi:hypothetical protein Syun_012822 [Stephania yunnanensis]|uniref:Branchpoint-bridging protein n=1 Tax=Stephania yunnanensis TaxID=152371 RepID=A0AAP0PGR2_9MAGN
MRKKCMDGQPIDKMTGQWKQEPSEDPGSELSLETENMGVGRHLSSSNEKKRALEGCGSDSDSFGPNSAPKKHRLEQSLDVDDAKTPSVDYLSKHGTSKVSMDDGNDNQQEEQTGSSGKRRRCQWDVEAEGNGEEGVCEKTSKRQKTRWDDDSSQLKMLGPLQLPSFSKKLDVPDLDLEIQKLKVKLREINRKILRVGVHCERYEGKYGTLPSLADDFGVKNKSRSVKYYEKLVKDRQCVISKLIKKNPTFMPPPEYKSSRFCKKLYIPVKEYPNYNFIGLIIGPRGNNQKRMEQQTEAKIVLRGKGSAKEKKGLQKPEPSDDDDLHVLVEAENQKSLDKAVKMVEELLIPVSEEKNELRRKQLRELAKINGSLKDRNLCRTCSEDVHKHHACLSLSSTFLDSNDSYGLYDGGSNRTTANCPPISPPCTWPDMQFHSFPADPRGMEFTSGPPYAPSYLHYGLRSSPSYGSHSHPGTAFVPAKGNTANGRIDRGDVLYGSYGSHSHPGTASIPYEGSNTNGRIDHADMFHGNLPHILPQHWSSNGDRRSPCAYSSITHHHSPCQIWPGPPGSLLSDAQSPSTEKDEFGLPPISVFLGHTDPSVEENPMSCSPCYVPVSPPSVAIFAQSPYYHSPYQPYSAPRDNFCRWIYPPHLFSRDLMPIPCIPCYPTVRIPLS